MLSISERKLTDAKLNLIKNRSKMKESDYKIEMAKLKLRKNDPTYTISSELNLLRQGSLSTAIFSFIDRNFILPYIAKFMGKKR
ncbi:hypothetical protein CCORG_0076 [Campylobacter corcagiensis]|nr:hypothetical protein CCORG_0076 [Campylobacter corcagiensis]